MNRVKIFSVCMIVLSIFAVSCTAEKAYNGYKNRAREKAGLVQKNVRLSDCAISYLEGGKGETVVFIHGFGAEKDYWTPMADYLTDNYHLIIPDLPGSGESEKRTDISYDVDTQARRIHEFLTALNAGKVIIAGNSMGGNIAGIFAVKYPSEIKGLILLDTLGIISPEKSDLAKSLELGINPLIVAVPEDFDRLIEYGFANPPYMPGPIKKLLAEQSIRNKPFNDKVWADINSKPAPLQDRLSKLTMPVLVIWGDKDRILHVSCVQVLEKNLPRCRTHILKDCGHGPMMERPEETAGYIREFMEKDINQI
ncbi:MAG: alpha/beta fold hydrolase [Spirochaetota bacterium]